MARTMELIKSVADTLEAIHVLIDRHAQQIQQLQQQQTRQQEQLNRLRTRVETSEQDHVVQKAALDNLSNRIERIETWTWLSGRKRRKAALPEPVDGD